MTTEERARHAAHKLHTYGHDVAYVRHRVYEAVRTAGSLACDRLIALDDLLRQ